MISLLRKSESVYPLKSHKVRIEARQRLGLHTVETIMVGDTMETDIRGAIEIGLQAFLVLTGSTRREDLIDYPYQPTRILNSIADLLEGPRYVNHPFVEAH